jgi:hypothetical protein
VTVPNPTPTQRVEELAKRVQELEKTVERQNVAAEFRLKSLEDQLKDRVRIEEELRTKVAELTAKNATLEERSRNQEKSSDRGWNIGQAAVISLVSMIGGALLSLLVQLAIKK